jgi:hypothetical protein
MATALPFAAGAPDDAALACGAAVLDAGAALAAVAVLVAPFALEADAACSTTVGLRDRRRRNENWKRECEKPSRLVHDHPFKAQR